MAAFLKYMGFSEKSILRELEIASTEKDVPIDAVYRVGIDGVWFYRTLQQLRSKATPAEAEILRQVVVSARGA
jgi:hypothetical protein